MEDLVELEYFLVSRYPLTVLNSSSQNFMNSRGLFEFEHVHFPGISGEEISHIQIDNYHRNGDSDVDRLTSTKYNKTYNCFYCY